MNLSNKKCIVYDYGIYPEIAMRLARDFGTVYYFCHWASAFPKSPCRLVGTGLDGIERIDNFWEYKKKLEKTDMIYFPDTLCGDIVSELRDQGYPVVGAGLQEEKFEQDRIFGRFTVQKEAGLPMQKTGVIKGITKLRAFLKNHENLWIKINAVRGDRESFHHIDYEQTEPILDKLAADRGPTKEDIEFICEEDIDGIEPGLDCDIFEGKTLSPCTYGYEMKGGGFIGRNVEYDKVPRPIKIVNDKLSPFFKKNKSRMPFSTEIKMEKDRVPFLIDPTCREAGPVGFSIKTEKIKNFSEHAYGLATGSPVDPIIEKKYCGGVSYNSEEASKNWVRIRFPKEMKNRLKLRMAAKIGKDYYALPGFDNIITAIGLSDTVQGVIDEIKEATEAIQAQGIDKDMSGLAEIQKKIEEGEKHYGIKF